MPNLEYLYNQRNMISTKLERAQDDYRDKGKTLRELQDKYKEADDAIHKAKLDGLNGEDVAYWLTEWINADGNDDFPYTVVYRQDEFTVENCDGDCVATIRDNGHVSNI